MSPQTLTGYYRYTDIWFDWHARLDPEDGKVLKALLAHDSLVHPEHPFHVDGVDGAQLYIGHFENGEARLLFSSIQVDYIRYWLKETGMTKDTIPLPWSDCLLTAADLKAVEPVVYKDGGAVRTGLKVIEKNNKRLKGNNPTLAHSRHTFERVRALYSDQKGAWCAMDFEDWEYDHTVNTEFGFRMVAWKDGEQIERHGHWIVEEARNYRNGRFVKDNRDRYQFGESEFVKRVEWKKRICDLIEEMHAYGPVYLVFHDYTQDIRTLEKLGAPMTGFTHFLPDSTPDKGLFVVDTAYMLAALLGESTNNRKGLEQMSHMLKQNPAFLHNAGNDAYYTFGCFAQMASGEQIDMQRERRWPNQTAGGSLWVKIKPEQEGREEDTDEETDVAPKLGYDPSTGKLFRTDMLDSDDSDDG